MTVLKRCVILSVILAGISCLLQTITFVIPGWFITETRKLNINMALWYLVMCYSESNMTVTKSCETFMYNSKPLSKGYEDAMKIHLGKCTLICNLSK
jgi:hypothetical protein